MEVSGSIPDRVILKTLKIVPTELLLVSEDPMSRWMATSISGRRPVQQDLTTLILVSFTFSARAGLSPETRFHPYSERPAET
jgi:hypothetical protein